MHRRALAGLLVASVLVCVTAAASDAPESPALKYFEESGLKVALEKQRSAIEAMVRSELQGMIAQFSEIREQDRAELGVIVDDMIRKIMGAYSVDETLRVYAEPFDRNYPGDEFQKAQALLSTPQGQKMSETIGEAVAAGSQYSNAKIQAAFREAMPDYIAKLRALAKSRTHQ